MKKKEDNMAIQMLLEIKKKSRSPLIQLIKKINKNIGIEGKKTRKAK